MATSSVNLPAGFELEQPQQSAAAPNVPAGFELEQPQQSQPGPSSVGGFLQGAYNTTVKPVVDIGSQAIHDLSASSAENHSAADAAEAQKRATYQEAGQHLKNGNFAAAAGALLSLYTDDPDNTKTFVGKLLDAHIAEGKKAVEMARQGRYSEAAGHALATAVPALGPGAAQAGEDIGKGDIAKGLGEGAGLIGTVVAPRVIGGAAGKLAEAAGDVKNPFATVPDTVQPDLHGAIRDTATKAADAAGVEAPSGNLRQTFSDLSDAVEAKSKDLYKQIDEATDNGFTNQQNRLRGINQKLRQAAGDDELEAKYEAQRDSILAKLDELTEQAKANGVDPAVAEQARNAWKQQSALDDVDNQLKAAMPGKLQANGAHVDVNGFANRVQKLYDSGRLTEALGSQDAADGFLKQAYDSVKQAESTEAAVAARKSNINTAKQVGKYAVGSAIGTGAVGAGLAHVLGGK